MQMIDELHKLERDLTGLMDLLYNMSDAAGKGAVINEASLMLLAEIAGVDADTVAIIIKKAEEAKANGNDIETALHSNAKTTADCTETV